MLVQFAYVKADRVRYIENVPGEAESFTNPQAYSIPLQNVCRVRTADYRSRREYLLKDGEPVEAMRLLARIEHQSHALEEAEQRLETVLKLAPNYRAARLAYVCVLLDQQKYLRAHDVIDTMLMLDPDDRDLLSLCAAA